MTAKDRKAMRASLDVVHQSGDDRTGESAEPTELLHRRLILKIMRE